MDRVSVVIPNYNGAELLKKTLPKVIESCRGCEIIVVDDASTDASVSLLKEKFPSVTCITRTANGGFSAAVNEGVSFAHGEYIFLLNSDAYPLSGWHHILSLFQSDPDLFAVGLLQRSIEEGDTHFRGRGVGSFLRGFLIHDNGTRGIQIPNNTLWVSGGAGIFRTSLWRKLGGMSMLFSPFYWEDIDLSYRALKAGYHIRFASDCVVVHEQSIGSIRTSYSTAYIRSIAYRNQFFFVWANISSYRFLFQHLAWLPYHCIKATISLDMPFFFGLFSACHQIRFVLQDRHQKSKYWKVSDQEVLHADYGL